METAIEQTENEPTIPIDLRPEEPKSIIHLTSVTKKVLLSFVVSLPLMTAFSPILAVGVGLGIWTAPVLIVSLLMERFYPEAASAVPIILLVILSSAQNAFMFWIYLKARDSSSRVVPLLAKIIFWLTLTLIIVGGVLVVTYMLFKWPSF